MVARAGGGSGAGPQAFAIPCGRARRVSGLWLEGAGGVLNLAPAVLPFRSRLVAIGLATASPATWTCEVYRNAYVRAGGTPLVGNALAVVSVTAADSGSATMSVDLEADDSVGVYLRGSMVDRPQVILYFKRRS